MIPEKRMRSKGDVSADERARAKTRTHEFEPTRTQTSHALDCDINVIAKRFGLEQGAIMPSAVDPSYYGDFTMDLTLGDAMLRIRDATEKFAKLPVAIRNRFDNSPAALWQFVTDPRNAQESVELGLLAEKSPAGARIAGAGPSGPVEPRTAATPPPGAGGA